MAAGPKYGGKVAAVLFDMDGLLLDTEGAYTVAQQRILDRFGRVFTWELKAKMMGRQALEAARGLLEELRLTPEEITPEQFLAERDALLQEAFAASPLMPGAERLVRHLAGPACGLPLAVATGSHRQAFELKTSLHRELFGLFRHVVTGDMVKVAKPHPEIFLKAAAGFSDPAVTDMSSVLVFEDAPNGVEAALAGGMRVVMAPYPGLPAELTAAAGATQVLTSLKDFRPEEWGLPPFPTEG